MNSISQKCSRWRRACWGGALLLAWVFVPGPLHAQADARGMTHVPIVFSGGHETDPRDRGRPDVLIAAALGVSTDVFREAFSHVHPAGPGQTPQEPQVRANKAALLSALGPYGVTDDRLNAVSNHYRYARSKGEMWPTRPAAGYALVKDGAVTGFVITDGGTGYSSPPGVSIPEAKCPTPLVQLSFGPDFDHNGAVTAITIPPS
jgi:hypothetical protein